MDFGTCYNARRGNDGAHPDEGDDLAVLELWRLKFDVRGVCLWHGVAKIMLDKERND